MSKEFAEQLEHYRHQAELTRQQLADQLTIAVTTLDNYRYKPYQRPQRETAIQLITVFKEYLTPEAAQAWLNKIDYCLTPKELQEIFPPPSLEEPPSPNRTLTFNRIPPLTEKLFGISESRDKLSARLSEPDDHWLMSIDGLGGIGKTALATAMIHHLLHKDRFYDVAWLSAKQEEFVSHQGIRSVTAVLKETNFVDALLGQLDPNVSLARSPEEKKMMLTHWLKSQPYLVVIDNLETIADVEELLTPARQLTNPSKFLFTTRHSLSDQADVLSFTVPRLSEEDACEMMWYAGDKQNIPALKRAELAHLQEIYGVVGGNPLALKLVIGQIRHSPRLEVVLARLREAQGKKIQDLYTYIYWQSWHALPEEARQVLRIMGLLKEGTAEDITDSDFHPQPLSDLALQTGLETLMRFSLVEKRGSLEEASYTIHRLTETFLMTNLFGWEDNDDDD